MTPQITDEQRQAIHEADTGAVRLVDPTTNTTYILMRADIYDRMQTRSQEFDPREAYPLIEDVMRDDDANDPTLASYQNPAYRGQAS